MENLIASLNAVLPIFFLLAVGYFLAHEIGGRKAFLTSDYLAKTNKLVFSLFLPCMLFNNVYKTPLKKMFNPKLMIFAFGSLILLYFILCLIVPRVVKNPLQRGVVIQGIFRSNYVIFGVSLVTNMFGAENAGVAAMLSAILVPTYNVLAVIALTVYTHDQKPDIKKTLIAIAKNPLILATIAGLLFSLAGIKFPHAVETTISDIAGLATPLALIVLGGDFDFQKARGNLKIALPVVILKLVIIPVIFVPIAVLMGFRGAELLAISLAWETPVAVSSYIMAQQAGADGALAGQLVVLSSSFCIVTVFIMIFILKSLGLL